MSTVLRVLLVVLLLLAFLISGLAHDDALEGAGEADPAIDT